MFVMHPEYKLTSHKQAKREKNSSHLFKTMCNALYDTKL